MEYEAEPQYKVVRFTRDHQYLGLDYYEGDEANLYEEEAMELVNLGVASVVEDSDGE